MQETQRIIAFLAEKRSYSSRRVAVIDLEILLFKEKSVIGFTVSHFPHLFVLSTGFCPRSLFLYHQQGICTYLEDRLSEL